MTREEKIKREENFEWWITSLSDKIIELNNIVPIETVKYLDGSFKSLDIIENYIIENYTIEYLKSKKGKIVLDNLASYLASTIHNLIPNMKWHIELEDKSDLYYCLPVLKKTNFPPLCPYLLPLTAIKKNTGKVFSGKVKHRL